MTNTLTTAQAIEAWWSIAESGELSPAGATLLESAQGRYFLVTTARADDNLWLLVEVVRDAIESGWMTDEQTAGARILVAGR